MYHPRTERSKRLSAKVERLTAKTRRQLLEQVHMQFALQCNASFSCNPPIDLAGAMAQITALQLATGIGVGTKHQRAIRQDLDLCTQATQNNWLPTQNKAANLTVSDGAAW